MEQLKVRVKDTQGKDWGIKKVMSITWDKQGLLWMLLVDFMEDEESSDYSAFYNYEGTETFTHTHRNLNCKIIWD